MIDVERPLPAPIAMVNRFILRWITSTSYITDAMEKVRTHAESGGQLRKVGATPIR
jgi:hypothetical protein